MTNAVRREVSATDAGVPLVRPGRLEDFADQGMYAGPRFGFLLMTVFGCVGLVLVTVGVYSVLAYSTTRKTHEIGIRMALGAKARMSWEWWSGAGCDSSCSWASRSEWQ